jgi:hypothetical protein
LIRLVACATLHAHPRVFQALGNGVKRRRIWHLPADDLQVVGPVVAELDAVGVLIHSQVGRRPAVAWYDLHAEHAGGEPPPGSEVADTEDEITELVHAGHGVFPPLVARALRWEA